VARFCGVVDRNGGEGYKKVMIEKVKLLRQYGGGRHQTSLVGTLLVLLST